MTSLRPTRAECSDIVNAVLDGSDCVMLSNETAKGKYPVECVEMMAKCCVEAESCIHYKRLFMDLEAMTPPPMGTAEAVASAACSAVLRLKLQLIIVLTDSGKLARLVSKYRPPVSILACCINAPVARHMNCMRGCIGLKIPTF